MFKNILVPTDFSEKSQQALEVAVEIAQLDRGNVTLLHVIETLSQATFEELENFYTKLEKQAWTKMKALITPYQNSQVEIKPKIIYGNRVQEILKVAADHNIELIIMNSHKVDLENPALGWGTISYKVAVLSLCPILLVK